MARNRERQSNPDLRIVTLVHGKHQWRFGCAPGEERLLVTAAARIAMEGRDGLDLADAAILARRLDAWPAGPEKRETH
ncbi:MAG: hypothetical protein IPJ41_14325 [Phycisphaerales bacterium]|nr:hypothetical protein [Phycisphaerales bacterium]